MKWLTRNKSLTTSRLLLKPPAGVTDPADHSDWHPNIKLTNHVVSLETLQSHNVIRDSIWASNHYHSFTYWPLLAGNNRALSPACAVQYLTYCSWFFFFMMGKIRGRLLKGKARDFSAGQLWSSSNFFRVFLWGNWNISSWRNRCNKSEIAVECPLNVERIEIQGKPGKVAVGDVLKPSLKGGSFILGDVV